jgi:hypothetical protein
LSLAEVENSPLLFPGGSMICDMDVAPGSVLITASVAESPDAAVLTLGA